VNPFSVGGVLGRSVGVWRANLVPFLVIATIAQVPVIALTYALRTGAITIGPAIAGWSIIALSTLLGMVTTGALAYGVIEQLAGRRASVGVCVGKGLARLWTLVGLTLLLFLVFTAVGIALMVSASLVVLILKLISNVLAAVVAATVILYPLVALYCRFYVAAAAVVVERTSASEALTRSAALTLGYRRAIFAIVFVITVVMALAAFVAGKILPDGLAVLITNHVIMIAWGALSSTACAVVYHDLRGLKEGVGVDQLAAVFE
jgi:hypothetical protein